VISRKLSGLRVKPIKETLPFNWDRETEILELNPDLVIIHKSALFHAMNTKFGFATPAKDPGGNGHYLYQIADRKLVTFLGSVGRTYPHTKFLVYSRGTDGLWMKDEERVAWQRSVENRFPTLKGRIETMYVVGGVESGNFDMEVNADLIRTKVQELLGLSKTVR
jgi:hypothetical protein